MELWIAVIVASFAVYSWKILGSTIPERYLNNPKVTSLASLLTVALMAGLVGVQGFVNDRDIVVDERLPALLLAVVMAIFRVPFILIVLVAAATAAALRFFW
ncbi:MAG: AzlD domain-containing protein [Micrococcales bacterium]